MADKIAVSIDIDAAADQVWAALTEPDLVKTYMMDATIDTDWQVGHPITWTGVYEGKPYQDKGVVKVFEPRKRIVVTHWSPFSGLADEPANHHLVSYELARSGQGTKLTLTQENLTGVSEEQSRKNWEPVLLGLKQTAEAA